LAEPKHRIIETNGIKMHIAEQGAGPLVILCHGFPEIWYSWKHQIPAIAKAGFRVVAPDQRGYGQTDAPEAIEDYDMFKLTADMVGLVEALGEEKAVVIGHDWGAPVAWHCALLRPGTDRVFNCSLEFITNRISF
jgi:pimeloyl-ACP methyl ester carboxylesterase